MKFVDLGRDVDEDEAEAVHCDFLEPIFITTLEP